jgi:uncharacterized protein (TIGR03382 family)
MKASRIAPFLLLAVAAADRPASACSPPQCWPGYFTPGDAATVPANLPAIYWRPVASGVQDVPPDPSMVVLSTAADPQTALPFTATPLSNGDYLLVPDAPLVAGTDYTIVDHTPCGATPDAGPVVTFHVVAEAPLPTSLGTLAIVEHQEETFSVATASGSCSTEVLGDQARVELTPSDDALAWKDALHYQTLVDGQPWGAASSLNQTSAPGSSWVGAAVDRLYHVCSTDDDTVGTGLAEGAHQVAMTATLPGSTISLDAAAVALDLACGGTGSGSGSGSDQPLGDDQVEDGCSAGGDSTGALALLALLVVGGRRRRAAR